MKVFIQNRHTKEYYREDGQWAPTRAGALDCRSSAEAESFAQQHKLGDISIVLTFYHGKEIVIVPMGAKIDTQGPPEENRLKS